MKYLVISPVWTANFDHKVLHVEKYICWILGNIFSVDLIMRFPYKLYNIWQGIKTIHNNLIRSINIYFKIYLTTQSKIASGYKFSDFPIYDKQWKLLRTLYIIGKLPRLIYSNGSGLLSQTEIQQKWQFLVFLVVSWVSMSSDSELDEFYDAEDATPRP